MIKKIQSLFLSFSLIITSFKGLALFGAHTTAHKVSIERENFKAIQVSDLSKLSANKVFETILLPLNITT